MAAPWIPLKFSLSHTFKAVFRKSLQFPVRLVSSFAERSHLCGELRASHVGQDVQLCGWLQHRRMGGAFLVLRDWKGTVQLNVPDSKMTECKSLPLETIIGIKGKVTLRPEGQSNKAMDTGQIEVLVHTLTVLNKCTPTLPFEVQSFNKVNEALRIKHRYLELRLPQLQRVLRTRSKFVLAVRNFLSEHHGFVEVETPTLFRRTPGGAREFIVPTHTSGRFYSLPQSPQQFKQLLMAGGLDRYFQIAKCYRDESTKPDRQPEFTQIDLEMSFTTQEGVTSLVEHMLERAWPTECGHVLTPFPRMTYQEAMSQYGTDKPDLRISWKLADVTKIVEDARSPALKDVLLAEGHAVLALRIPQGNKHLSNKNIQEIVDTSMKATHSEVRSSGLALLSLPPMF
ncbi:aspartate--tRNA(Asp/Asn) ligase [Elysia marginata]|uniref:Aspartate--tRNA(Asp/Asn) ligase n=1 Tax=Elysia marginata TaxID=1093978 RepID=A0AAV4GA33_9GAST|nr:aspartate--tRNA(Asp/Asn) ligase [Elysia marginata]